MCDFIFEHRERQRKKHFCLLRCLSAFATPIKLYFRCVFKLLPYVALALWLSPFIVRARPCFQDGVFRVPKNGMLETNKPLAMRVVGNALAYRKNLQCYNNAGSPTALQAEEVSIWI